MIHGSLHHTPSHAPEAYPCPFCLLARGVVNEHVWSRESDVVYRDQTVLAFIAAAGWPNNPGHVLVVPVAHFENLYTLPDTLGARLQLLSRRVALAMKAAYGCPGTSTRQHNEPGSGQDVWHFHTHIFPRWPDDGLYSGLERRRIPLDQRAGYADQMRPAMQQVLAELPLP